MKSPPSSRELALHHVLGAMNDAQRLRHDLAFDKRHAALPTRWLGLAQDVNHALLQCTMRVRIDSGINRLGANIPPGRIIRVHTS